LQGKPPGWRPPLEQPLGLLEHQMAAMQVAEQAAVLVNIFTQFLY
jgi:hypothetical protein